MNVVFLDYDGVVNTPMWDQNGMHCKYNFPEDNMVNNFQCVQWVSEFCEKCDYKIVVTSTWRSDDNYTDCLKNGGLRKSIEVIGRTPLLGGNDREKSIQLYLDEHSDVENFLIFDDEDDIIGKFKDHLILCDPTRGFGMNEYFYAKRLHEKLNNKKLIS